MIGNIIVRFVLIVYKLNDVIKFIIYIYIIYLDLFKLNNGYNLKLLLNENIKLIFFEVFDL